MLIRSQDKMFLVDISGIEFNIVGNKIKISKWVDHYRTIGVYSTQEKAIKVLDLIQKVYISQNKISQTYMENIGVLESGYVGCEVLQMPQESEVV